MENNFHVEYLKKVNFQKRLEKLSKKLKNKSIVIYGTGMFFEDLKNSYDLSALNIIAVSDRKFTHHEQDEEFLGYKVCAPEEIAALNPDYVLVATINIVKIMESLENTVLKGTKIKLMPLVKKTFKDIWNEIWDLI